MEAGEKRRLHASNKVSNKRISLKRIPVFPAASRWRAPGLQKNAPRQLAEAEFDAIWGMLLFEKKIDFTLTSEQLHVPKYHLFRAIYKILVTTPMEFKLTETSIELLEDKDLTTFFAALKDEFSRWQTADSNPPQAGGN